MIEIQTCKEEYEKKGRELAREKELAEQEQKYIDAIKNRQNAIIEQRVAQMYTSREKRLKIAYKAKEAALYGAFGGTLLYALLITVLTAYRSERFISDFKAFFICIWTFILGLWEKALIWANKASQWGDKIPQETVATVVHYILLGIVFLIVFGGILALIGFAGYRIVRYYLAKYTDNISLAVFLVSLAVSVWFGEWIRNWLPVNLLLLVLVVYALYIGVRWCIESRRRAKGYY